MKTKQQSEPPAAAGGLTEQITDGGPQDDPALLQETLEGVTLKTLQSENAQLKAAIRLRDAQASVTTELGKSGARSPELLWDALRHELEFDDEGKPVNSAELIAVLKAKFPEQFGTHVPHSIDGGAGQTETPRLTKSALSKMKPAEIARLDWADVKRVLAAR